MSLSYTYDFVLNNKFLRDEGIEKIMGKFSLEEIFDFLETSNIKYKNEYFNNNFTFINSLDLKEEEGFFFEKTGNSYIKFFPVQTISFLIFVSSEKFLNHLERYQELKIFR